MLGIALSEKQIPQVVVTTEKWCERMEELERTVVLRRQMLYPAELRARRKLILPLTAFSATGDYGAAGKQRPFSVSVSPAAIVSLSLESRHRSVVLSEAWPRMLRDLRPTSFLEQLMTKGRTQSIDMQEVADPEYGKTGLTNISILVALRM